MMRHGLRPRGPAVWGLSGSAWWFVACVVDSEAGEDSLGELPIEGYVVVRGAAAIGWCGHGHGAGFPRLELCHQCGMGTSYSLDSVLRMTTLMTTRVNSTQVLQLQLFFGVYRGCETAGCYNMQYEVSSFKTLVMDSSQHSSSTCSRRPHNKCVVTP